MMEKKNPTDLGGYKLEIVWPNVVLMLSLHLFAIYGYLNAIIHAKWQTWLFGFIIGNLSAIGIQAGAHRLWSHRSYKAKLPLRVFLAFLQTLALQNNIYDWCRDHRTHHKFSDTDADPHNSRRGFFFSHVGWLLCKKHPQVKSKGQTIEMNDLLDDPVVRFQKKYYVPLVIAIWFMLPTYIPYLFWCELKWVSFTLCVLFRYCYTLNVTWLVNSAAHMWGNRPYDQKIEPREASVRHLLQGEGFHNYHHSFPWDYSASELGAIDVFNPATAFIDFFYCLGLAYDLKIASTKMIRQKQMRSAVSSHSSGKSGKPNCVSEWLIGLLIVSSPITVAFVTRKLLFYYFTFTNNPNSVLFI